MQQSMKQFSMRLNKCLDDMEIPTLSRERSAILSKMLHIPKQQAWGLLEGHTMPDDDLLKKIARELDIDPSALLKQ